ncbi:NAD-dependent epimerase/dehydratase family protein [Streptomyces sp. URMC 127]|uniref:NAD-dependent epimerase/dehydratase family protein n=1 Tax=Streptomyces sp. URMC 127 TaxID=3423402 RepID=UPI003F1D2F9A
MTWLITGASGTIGTGLTRSFAQAGIRLRLRDLHPLAELPPGAEFVQADLRDLGAVSNAAADVNAVIHLGGTTHEASFPQIAEHPAAVRNSARRFHRRQDKGNTAVNLEERGTRTTGMAAGLGA